MSKQNKQWSENAQTWMSILGEFVPTEDNKFVKGLAYDFEGEGGLCSVYRDADCLRRIAAACLEVADSLDGEWIMNTHGMNFQQLAEMTSYDLHIGCWTCGVWLQYTEAPHPLVGKTPTGEYARQAAEQEWELVLWLTDQGWSGDQEGHLECPSCTTKRLEEEGEDNHAEPPRRWTW